jgi:tetratricopeptide (TPR) repeat protein
MSPILPLLLALQQAPSGTAAAVVAEAAAAVAGDSVSHMTARWSARLGSRGEDRGARLGLATLARLRYDYPEAERRYAELLASDWSRADEYAVYAALGQADALVVLGRMPDADRMLEQALTGARALGDSLAVGEVLLRLGGARVRTRGLAIGRAYFDSAMVAFPASAPDLAAAARCRRAHLDLLQGATTAAANLAATLDLATQHGYRRAQAFCLRGRQIDLLYRGERDSALAMLRRLESLRREARDRAGLSETLLWQADVFLHRTAYGEAREVLRRALVEAAAAKAASVTASVELDLGQVFFALNDQVTAVGHLDRAIAAYASLGDRRGEMLARSWRGSVRRAAGDWAGARAEIGEALEFYRSQGDVAYQAEQYQELTDIEMGAGDFAAAGRQLDSLKALAKRYGGGEWSVALPYQRGRLAMRQGELRRARQWFTQYLVGLDSAEHLARYEVRTYLADVDARSGRPAEAERELTTAMTELEEWRATVDDAELRAFAFQAGPQFVNDHNASVARVLAGLVDSGRVASAFALAERRRARELGDRLAQGQALATTSGTRAKIVRTDPIPTAEDVAAILPQDSTALLEFVTGSLGAPTTVFVLTRSSGAGVARRAYTATPADSLVDPIDRFLGILEGGGAAEPLARELGRILLWPALKDLSPGIKRLVVIPDGPLHRVPFDALQLADGRYVVERYSISVAPSARVISALWRRGNVAQQDSAAPLQLLAFGDPAVDSLPRLQAAGREAKLVAEYAPSAEVRLGKEASAEYLKHASLARFGVLHFATHALVDDHSLAGTALALAGSERDGGLVGPGDLAALQLNADLVVLSGCRSAGGVVVTGEGIQGLTAPLLAAGARAVVASQWQIGDRSTVPFIEAFYRAMARGQPVGEALRAAKLDALRRGAPAATWAGFTLVGDPLVRVPLRQARRPWGMEVAGAVLVLAGLVYGWRIRKRWTLPTSGPYR